MFPSKGTMLALLALTGCANLFAGQACAEPPPPAGASVSATLTQQKPAHALAYRPDGKKLATGDELGMVWLWDVASREPLILDKCAGLGRVAALTFSADGALLATAHVEPREPACSTVRIWNVAEPSAGNPFPAEKPAVVSTVPAKGLVRHLAFAPGSKQLAVLDGQVVRLCDAATGKETERLRIEDEGGPWAAARLAFSQDGRFLAVAGGRRCRADPEAPLKGAIKLWDLQRHLELGRLDCSMVEAYDVAFSPDGRFLATAGWCDRRRVTEAGREVVLLAPGAVEVWELATRRCLAEYAGHTAACSSVTFAPDGLTFATGAADQTVRVWRLTSDRQPLVLQTKPELVRSVAFAPDGRSLAVAGNDKRVDIWQVPVGSGQAKQPLAAEALAKAWAALADDDPARAYSAAVELATSPGQALELTRQVQPPALADANKIRALIAGLQSDQFAERDRSARELEKLEGQAAAALEEALAGHPPLDLRKRLERLLAQAAGKPSRNTLRALRTVTMLQLVGSEEARGRLEEWARGTPAAHLTQAAQSALKCLEYSNRGR